MRIYVGSICKRMLRSTATGRHIFNQCKVFSLFYRGFSDELLQNVRLIRRFSLTDLLYDNELDSMITTLWDDMQM